MSYASCHKLNTNWSFQPHMIPRGSYQKGIKPPALDCEVKWWSDGSLERWRSIQYLWDELEWCFRFRTNHPASGPDLSKALRSECNQVSTAMFQYVMEFLPEEQKLLLQQRGTKLPYSFISEVILDDGNDGKSLRHMPKIIFNCCVDVQWVFLHVN